MSNLILIRKGQSIDNLVIEIRSCVHDAGRADTLKAKHQLHAGLKLLELRKRIDDGEAGEVDWWEWYATKFTGHIKNRKYAEKLMRWAAADDPEDARQKEKDQSNAANRRRRQATKASGSCARSKNTKSDIVEEALTLVGQMNEEQLERFDAHYRSEYQ